MDTPTTEIRRRTPRDFFLYLFATGAIYFISVQVIALLWQYVNYFFPDPNAYFSEGFSSPMRWAIASLIILFPAYVWVMRFLGKDLDQHPEKKELGVRRWLIYITLFIAAVTIIVDLVVLLNNFLGGDLTARFALKALSVLLVAGAVFKYYLFNLRREPGAGERARKILTYASLIGVFALIIGAFFIVGSPATNRLRNLDNRRVSDLQTIQWQIINFWQQKQFLPATLADLEDPLSGFVLPKDPKTGEAYEYVPATEDLAFQLCATFALKSTGQTLTGVSKPMPVDGFETPAYWEHAAGRACFSRTIDPDKYPPYLKTR